MILYYYYVYSYTTLHKPIYTKRCKITFSQFYLTIFKSTFFNCVSQCILKKIISENYLKKEALMKYITNNQNYDGVYTNIFNKNTENYTYVTYIDPYNKNYVFGKQTFKSSN